MNLARYRDVFLANAACGVSLYVSFLRLLPFRAEALTATSVSRDALLGITVAVGALAGCIGGFAAGWAWDAIRSKRSCIITLLIVIFAAAISLVGVSLSDSRGQLLTSWATFQVALNTILIVTSIRIITSYPKAERGRGSSAAGLGQVSGALIAGGLVLGLHASTYTLAWAAAILFVAGLLPLAMSTTMPATDAAVQDVRSDGIRWKRPDRPYQDTALLWVVRAAVMFSLTLVLTYATYYVSDSLHVTRPDVFIAVITGLLVSGIVVGAAWSGARSDRAGRRQPFVKGSLVGLAGGQVILGIFQSSNGALIAALMIGLSYGVYLAIDQALILDALPYQNRAGRDLGMLSAANTMPQVVAPVIGAAILAIIHSYGALYIFGGIVSACAILAVARVESVK